MSDNNRRQPCCKNQQGRLYSGRPKNPAEEPRVWREDPDDRVPAGEGEAAREPQPPVRANRVPGVRAHDPDDLCPEDKVTKQFWKSRCNAIRQWQNNQKYS